MNRVCLSHILLYFVTKQAVDENRKKLFNWCSSVNPYQKHRTAKSLRHPNTVLWFFESEEWHTWTKEPNYAIWLYGIRKSCVRLGIVQID